MKMEVRVFANSPIMAEEITDWFKSQQPRIPITVSVVERSDEHRTAVYALFLDAPVVASVAVGVPVGAPLALSGDVVGDYPIAGGRDTVAFWQADSAKAWDKCEERRLENEAMLALLERWNLCAEAYVKQFDELHMPHETLDALIAHTALALKKHGRA